MIETSETSGIGEVDEVREPLKRSSLKPAMTFPYVNLEDSVAVAKVMHDAGSVPLGRDQIAARMNANPDSSTFAIKVSAAQMFGLISKADSRLQITETGSAILSPDEIEAQSARVAAFLNVELYKRLVEHLRGKILPPKEGVEAAMVNFGVAPKQKDRARQAFERSASFAGYLNSAKDRLVPPITGVVPANGNRNIDQLGFDAPSPAMDHTLRMGVARMGNDPSEEKLIRGMLDRMPRVGEPWPIADRARWLRRLAHNLAMVYAPDEDAEIDVSVVEGGE